MRTLNSVYAIRSNPDSRLYVVVSTDKVSANTQEVLCLSHIQVWVSDDLSPIIPGDVVRVTDERTFEKVGHL